MNKRRRGRPKSNYVKQIHILLDEEMLNGLERLVERDERSRSDTIRMLIRKAIRMDEIEREVL